MSVNAAAAEAAYRGARRSSRNALNETNPSDLHYLFNFPAFFFRSLPSIFDDFIFRAGNQRTQKFVTHASSTQERLLIFE
jgi:hypothetical protein